MKWRVVDGFLEDEDRRTADEGQTVELKTSLAEEREGIQTLVAFANAQGGRVFFGVENTGRVVRVSIGSNTVENLANAIKQHSYPSLPATVEVFESDGAEAIIVVEVWQDVPPVVGVYIYCSQAINPSHFVDADGLQTFRRVGRTNQKEDFMRMRREQPSDPRLRVALEGSGMLADLQGLVWAEEGSPIAHNVTFRLDPPICECSDAYTDLPWSYESHRTSPTFGYRHRGPFSFSCANPSESPPSSVDLIATYKDNWGLTWESTRCLNVVPLSDTLKLQDRGEFRRRIVKFPPKEQR